MLRHNWIAAHALVGLLSLGAIAQAAIIQDEADYAVFNTIQHYPYPYPVPDLAFYDEPVGGNDSYIYAYPFNEVGNTVSQYTWTPGLTGLYDVSASWAIGDAHAVHSEYFFDADGAGPIAEVSLLPPATYVSQSLDANGQPFVSGNHWSGFLQVGSGLSLTPASVFRVATGTAGEFLTAGVWQFTAVPEPTSGALCAFGALGMAIWLRGRRNRTGSK